MNSLVAAYRDRKPDDTRSDEELTLLLGRAHDIDGRYSDFPDFVDEYTKLKATAAKEDVPFSSELRRGLKRGVSSLNQSAVGFGALAADVVGAEGLRDKALGKYKDLQEEDASVNAPGVARIEDVGSASDLARYVMGKGGELIPQIAEAALTGVAGAAAGSAIAPGAGTAAGGIEGFLSRKAAKKLLSEGIESILERKGLAAAEKAAVKDQITNIAEKRALSEPLNDTVKGLLASETKAMLAKGGGAGAELANFYGIGAGTIYGETANREGVDKADARRAALVGGIGSAIANAPLPLMVISRFFPGASQEVVRSYMQRLALDAAKEIPIGAGGEVLDELFQIAAEKYADPKLRDTSLSDEDLSRLLNAGVVGGFAGAVAAPVSAAPSHGFHPVVEQHFKDVPDERRRQIAALVVRTESGTESEQDTAMLRTLNAQERNFATVFSEMPQSERDLYAAASQDLGGDSHGSEKEKGQEGDGNGLLISREETPSQTTAAEVQPNTAGAETTAPASITPEENQSLIELGYNQQEISNLRPEEAKSIVDAGLESPRQRLRRASVATNIEDPAVAAARAKVVAAAAKTNTEPTEKQKETGNYQKGKVNIDGFNIAIENPVGSERSGKDASGKPWSVQMPAHYGYFTDANGSDGDKVDVYVGPNPTSPKVFVIDQTKQDGSFDETKTMFGFDTKEQAVAAYDAAFSDGRGPRLRGAVTEITKDRLREWLDSKQTKKAFAYEATPTSQIAKIGALTGPQFASMAAESKGGFTIHAYKFGASLKNEYELEALRIGQSSAEKEVKAAKKQAEEAIRAGNQDALKTAIDDFTQLGFKLQWFNEAIEAATGSEKASIKEALGQDYVAPFGKKPDVNEPETKPAETPEPVAATAPIPETKPASVFSGKIGEESRAITLDDVGFAEKIYQGEGKQSGWFRTGGEVTNRELATKLISDYSPTSKESKTNTHRLTAVLDKKTGKVHLLSTYATHDEIMITKPEGGKRPGTRVNTLLDAKMDDGNKRYQVIGSAYTKTPTNFFNQSFDSLEKFESEFGKPSDEAMSHALGQASAVEGGIMPTGERERRETIDDSKDTITIPEERLPVALTPEKIEILKSMPAFDTLQEMATYAMEQGFNPELQDLMVEIGEQDPYFFARVVKNGLEEELKAYEKGGVERVARKERKPKAVASEAEDLPDVEPVGERGLSGPEAALAREQDRLGEQGQEGDGGNEEPLAPGELENRPTRGWESTGSPEQHVSDPHYEKVVNDVLNAAAQAGLDVRVLRGDFNRGRYNQEGRVLRQVVSHAVGVADAITAFHEVAHDVFLNESQEVQDSILAAISKLSDRDIGLPALNADPRISESNPANLPNSLLQHERLVDATARRLVREGFNPTEAKGFADRFVRALKDVYYAAVKLILRAAGQDFSEKMAQDYFTHQVKALLAGDRNGLPFMQWARIGTPSLADRGAKWYGVDGRNTDGAIGSRIDYQPVADLTTDATRFNAENVFNNLPIREDDKIGRKTEIEKVVAPLNHLISLQDAIAKAVEENTALRKLIEDSESTTMEWIRSLMKISDPAKAKELLDGWQEVGGGKVEYDANKTIDGFADKSNLDAMLKRAYQNTDAMFAKMSRVKADAMQSLETLTAKLKRQKERIVKDREEYKNIDGQSTKFRKEVAKSFRDIFNSIAKLSTRKGVIEQQLAQIDKSLNIENYAKAFEEIIGGPLNNNVLFDTVDAMANDPAIDLSKPITEIRQAMTGQPTKYDIFLKDTNESRALLATVVAFAKTHAETIADLELRREKSGDKRDEIENKIAAIKAEKTEFAADLRELSKTAKLEERARKAYYEKLKRIRATERSIALAKNRIAVVDAATPVVTSELSKLGAKLDLASDFVLADGATYLAVKPGMNNAEAIKATKKLVLDKSTKAVSNPKEVEAQLLDMKGWLTDREKAYAGGDLSAKDSVYQHVNRQFHEMAGHLHYNMDAEPAERWLWEFIGMSEFKTLRDAFNTPAAQAFEKMGNLYERVRAALVRDGTKVAHKVTQMEDALIKIAPMSRETLRSQILNPVKNLLQYHTEDLAEIHAGNRSRLEDAAYDRARKMLLNSEYTKNLVGGKIDEFMPVLRQLLELQHESNKRQIQAIEKGVVVRNPFTGKDENASVGVLDPKLKVYDPVSGKMVSGVRRHLQVGPWTFSQKLSQEFNVMVNALRNSEWGKFQEAIGRIVEAGEDTEGSLGNIGEAYKEDPEKARELVAKFFNHREHGDHVRNSFLRALAEMPRSLFDAPVMEDGVTSAPANPDLVSQAINSVAPGDAVGFAEELFDLHDGKGGKAKYVQQVMQRIADVYAQVDGIDRKSNSEPSSTRVRSIQGMTPDAMITAREIEDLPGTWFDYHNFDQRDMFRSAQNIASEIAFGRGQERGQAMVETMANEIDDAISRLNSERIKVQRINPGMIEQDVEKIVEKNLGDRYKYLKRFEDRQHLLNKSVGRLSDYFRKENSPDGTVRVATRAGGFLGALMVNNPGSALYQMSQLFDTMFRYGVSPSTLATTGRVISKSVHEMAASMMQAIGVEIGNDAEYQQLRNELGLTDPAAVAKIKDSFDRWHGESAPAFFLRSAGDVIQSGVNPVGEDAQHVVFRPGGVFSMSTNVADWGLTYGMWKMAERFVAKGMEHIKANPEKLESNYAITAKDLGLKEWNGDREAFERLKLDMSRWGINFDQMVRSAIKRGDGTAFTNEEALRLHSMAMSEISSQANLSTMTAAAWNNSVIRFMIPLLGWSIRRTMDVSGKRLDQNGVTSMKAVARGLAALSVISVGGLAISALVDRYYEDLLNKKRNLRPILSPGGFIEHTARLGQTGLFGELANGVLSMGTGGDSRIISLDRRVVALSAFQTLQNSIATMINQGEADYARVIRPMAASLGAGGMLQYMQLVNNAFGLDNAESRITARMNAQNYLRAGGRELGMDVRGFSGGGGVHVNPLSPYISRMELAAYGNNAIDFQQAYREAIDKAKQQGFEDPVDHVKRSFAARNPLKLVFQTALSESEYKKLLNSLPADGRQDVGEAVEHFNTFAQVIGARPFEGTKDKTVKLAAPKQFKPADFRAALQFR